MGLIIVFGAELLFFIIVWILTPSERQEYLNYLKKTNQK